MPRPEDLPNSDNNPDNKEKAPQNYIRSARFGDEETSEKAYLAAQESIAKTKCELSVFRLIIDDAWHVAVIGDSGPPELILYVESILTTGELVELPTPVVAMLKDRRAKSIKVGPWVEGHYRRRRRTK